MTDTEKKVLLKLLQDNKDMKKQLDYLVEAVEILVTIQTESIEKHS